MSSRYLCGALATVALTCGVVVVGSANAQTRDGGLLPPEESGLMTIAGCYLPGGPDTGLGDKSRQKIVLAKVVKGPINSVPDAECSAGLNDSALQLHRHKEAGMNEQLFGHWVEISGRLEKEQSDRRDDLREFYVRSFRVLPVVPPRRAEAPAPAPEAFVAVIEPEAPSPAPAPVATSGQAPAPLPKTAGYGPTTGLIGVLALAGCLMVRSFRSRQVV